MDNKPKPLTPAEEYVCAACHGVFVKTRSDHDAMIESAEEFGVLPEVELAIVCDNCYRRMKRGGYLG